MMTTFFTKQGSYYVEAFPYKGLEVNILIAQSVRGALGNSSYAPGCIIVFLKENWAQLEEQVRFVTMRDILEWLGNRHNFVVEGKVDTAHPDEWRKFLTWALAQNNDEANRVRKAVAYGADFFRGVDEFLLREVVL